MPIKPTTTAEIREAFLAFFAAKSCVRYASASLVPENDPTTLFTVAGMSQFKDMFLGRGTHPFSRATTVQKCIRTNDILNVGRTARHHTFFEMLGNFSFNDYFKREAIAWAWEFLTVTLQIPGERLSISVHRIDDEAYRIWREEIGIPAERIFKLGDGDNFWPANAPSEGPEGPGGCCSEIFYDHRTNNDPNDNLASSTGRFVEIWNLVFPQFNVRKPHADGSPNLEDLGRTNIDTGSGLERVAAVQQGVYNNYDTDVFQTIIKDVCAVTGRAYTRDAPLSDGSVASETNALIRRVADHCRAVTFCVADGALPGNADRGYIVRRLIRRATLDLQRLGLEEAGLHRVVPAVIAAMGSAYPEIARRQDLAAQTLEAEEKLFRRTLKKGLEQFQRALDKQRGSGVFSGDEAFELVTTHGFPKEVIAELAGNDGLKVDEAQFQRRWEAHQQVSSSKGVEVFTASALLAAKPRLGATPFQGYDTLELKTAIALLEQDGKETTAAPTGATVRFALERTPFYAESGGQVGDIGTVRGDGFTIAVTDVQKDEGLVVHIGTVQSGTAQPGAVTASVDANARAATTRHHSATHLLHSALNAIVGAHVEQQGSRVSPTELRFDINSQAVSKDQQAQLENWVAQAVAAKHAVAIRELPIAEAKVAGAKALFGEKYGDRVRVVTMGSKDVSIELCGGCHVANTGDIGAFRIIKEEAVSAGVRRITAVAGAVAEALAGDEQRLADACATALGGGSGDTTSLGELARTFKAKVAEVPERLAKLMAEVTATAAKSGAKPLPTAGTLAQRVVALQEQLKGFQKAAEQAAAQAAAGLADAVVATAEDLGGGAALIAARCDGFDAKALGFLADAIRGKRPGALAVLIGSADGKVPLLVAVDAALVKRGVKAGELLAAIAPKVGGRGGGKPELAQGAGSDAAGIDAALALARELARQAVAKAATAG